jgi:exonuclease III
MPGRKSTQELIAEEEKKVEQLKARMGELKARLRGEDRKKDTHRKIVVGGAVMAHIRIDAQFRQNVRDALNKAVTEPKHRNVIPDLLSEQGFQDAMRAAAAKAEIEAQESQNAPEKQPGPGPRPPQQANPGTQGRRLA